MNFSHLERLKIHVNKFSNKGNVSDKNFMIHVLNNLPKEYDLLLDGLESYGDWE